MTVQAWLTAACLVIGAFAVLWPARTARRRWQSRGEDAPRRRTRPDVSFLARVATSAGAHPHRATIAAGVGSALAGWAAGGPVAALTAGAYVTLAARAALRRGATRRLAAARARSLDSVCAVVADLRAGLPPVPVRADPSADRRITDLCAAVWRLAERTGAPAADLMERVEADARAADRSRASAAAQAAGAQATALLLAALPAGGIALGYGIGVDPLAVLLHTPLGAACAVGTVLLQSAGLAWAAKLAGGSVKLSGWPAR